MRALDPKSPVAAWKSSPSKAEVTGGKTVGEAGCLGVPVDRIVGVTPPLDLGVIDFSPKCERQLGAEFGNPAPKK